MTAVDTFTPYHLEAPIEGPLAARQRLLATVGGDEALLHELVRLFAGDAPRQIAGIRAGIAGGDAAAIYMSAHTLRGAAANFGPTPLLDTIAELEHWAKRGDIQACEASADRVVAQTTALLDGLGNAEELLRCAS